MGSFVGHVDGAGVFIILATWWMYKDFTLYIRSSYGKGQYQIQMSYWCYFHGRRLPLEQILKIVFPVIAFLAEMIDGKFTFINKDGDFTGLNHLQHMSIYGIFVVHGVIDLLMRLEVPWMAPNMDFLSAGVAFFWYALSFNFHANMPGKEPLEVVIHILPTYIMYLVSFCFFFCIYNPQSFAISFLRCFGLLTLGTWFTHTSFIMYIPGFPGSHENLNWKRSDHRNVHFMIATFGYHLIVNLILTSVIYSICHFFVMRRERHLKVKYSDCFNSDEEVALIDNFHDEQSVPNASSEKSVA